MRTTAFHRRYRDRVLRRNVQRYDRASPTLRVFLLGAGLLLLLLGWLYPLTLPATQRGPWEALRGMAAIPTTAWAVLDATMSYLRSRQNIAVRSIDDKIDRVLIYLEQMAYDRDKPFMLSECGLRVWAVDPLSVKDRMKRERRQPLVKVAMSPIHRRGSSSGLKWRVGMGVIGTSLQSSQPLLLDVDDLWKGLRSCSQQDWEDQDDHVRLGLTHEQFTRLCPSDPRYPLGPTILAVPYFSGDRPAGVCALDMSKAAAEALASMFHASGSSRCRGWDLRLVA